MQKKKKNPIYNLKLHFIYFTNPFHNSPNITISIFTYNLLK